MSILSYLLGVFISAALWFILIKVRQEGFYIPMPRKADGNLLDPLDKPERIDWTLLMLGWFVMTVAWPFCWALLILFYLSALLVTIVGWVWTKTIGSESFARKVFGVRE